MSKSHSLASEGSVHESDIKHGSVNNKRMKETLSKRTSQNSVNQGGIILPTLDTELKIKDQ